MRELLLIAIGITTLLSCSDKESLKSEKFVVHSSTSGNSYLYSIVNSKNDTILKLDPEKYWVCFDDTVENFLVVAPKDKKGWWAIDFKENFLFQVYNTSEGEPSPDELNFNRIRIVDEAGKIGFADETGKVVITPAFEQATAFNKDYAIIGESCRKIPWDTTHTEAGCNHYSIECARNGYIDKAGNVMDVGLYTLEELWDKLDFPER
ncbi:WG repeat-containing protein [Chryseolinea sp. T2]|uniref:WG repeat-containing protein n=1 Tax=Chryseolinea sp. T2 TaxID=3129255 RepID=UPI0030770FE1